MDLAIGMIIGLLFGAGIILVGQFTISTGLLGRKIPTSNKPPTP